MLPYRTWKSVTWFVVTWLLTIGLVTSVATSYWLTGSEDPKGAISHWGFIEDCGFASNSSDAEFSCNGFRTEYTDYVLLVVMALIGVGVLSMLILATISLVYCFCDTLTACGRSFHCLAGFWQAIAAVFVLLGILGFPMTWSSDTVRGVCRTSGWFQVGDCVPGWSLYVAIACATLSYIVGVFSIALDSATFRITKFESMESLDTYKQRSY